MSALRRAVLVAGVATASVVGPAAVHAQGGTTRVLNANGRTLILAAQPAASARSAQLRSAAASTFRRLGSADKLALLRAAGVEPRNLPGSPAFLLSPRTPYVEGRGVLIQIGVQSDATQDMDFRVSGLDHSMEIAVAVPLATAPAKQYLLHFQVIGTGTGKFRLYAFGDGATTEVNAQSGDQDLFIVTTVPDWALTGAHSGYLNLAVISQDGPTAWIFRGVEVTPL